LLPSARFGDVDFESLNLGGGELAPAISGGDRRGETMKQELAFREGETSFFGEMDEGQAVRGVGGLDAAAVSARRWGEQAGPSLEADGGGIPVC
jgi:hypothetical protein